MNKYDAEAEALREAVEKAKKSPTGMDFPVQNGIFLSPLAYFARRDNSPPRAQPPILRAPAEA